jgi:hypothetical protein
MKLLVSCLLLSFVLHLVMFLLFSNVWVREPAREVIIDFQALPAPEVADAIQVVPEQEIKEPAQLGFLYKKPPNPVNLAEYKAVLALPESAQVINDSLAHITHEELFIVDTVYLARPDYSKLALAEQMNTGATSGLRRPDGGAQNYNNVAEQIYRQSSGHPQPSVSILGLLGSGVKELSKVLGVSKEPGPVRLDFIPETKELHALNIIWQNRCATDVMIYAAFDTCLKVTAEDLRKVLDGLVEKGLLQKEIVSPRDEFTFFGLMGDDGIEMNKTNLRNRIFEYQPLISKQEMKDYLNAVLYQQKNGMNVPGAGEKDTPDVLPDIQSLLDMLFKDSEN